MFVALLPVPLPLPALSLLSPCTPFLSFPSTVLYYYILSSFLPPLLYLFLTSTRATDYRQRRQEKQPQPLDVPACTSHHAM